MSLNGLLLLFFFIFLAGDFVTSGCGILILMSSSNGFGGALFAAMALLADVDALPVVNGFDFLAANGLLNPSSLSSLSSPNGFVTIFLRGILLYDVAVDVAVVDVVDVVCSFMILILMLIMQLY